MASIMSSSSTWTIWLSGNGPSIVNGSAQSNLLIRSLNVLSRLLEPESQHPQRNAAVATGESHRENSSSLRNASVTERPCMSSDVA